MKIETTDFSISWPVTGAQSLKHSAILIFNVKLVIFLFREFLAFFPFKQLLNSGNSSNEKYAFHVKYKISKDVWEFHHQ